MHKKLLKNSGITANFHKLLLTNHMLCAILKMGGWHIQFPASNVRRSADIDDIL